MSNPNSIPRRLRLNNSLIPIKYLLYYSAPFFGNPGTQLFSFVGSLPSSRTCFSGEGSHYNIIAWNPQPFRKVHSKPFHKVISLEHINTKEFSDSYNVRMQSTNSELVPVSPTDKEQNCNTDGNAAKSSKNSMKNKKQDAKHIRDSVGDYYSLAHLASSPERFAASLGMTPEQVTEAIDARKAASSAFHEQLVALTKELEAKGLSAQEIGRIKHEMICNHRYENLRNPFVCRKCWTHIPICVCPLVASVDGTARGGEETIQTIEDMIQRKSQLPKGVERVVVWTHHDEWGKTSNTGSLLPLSLQHTDMLMKGLKEHEEIMNNLLNRADLTPVVLWPGKSTIGTDSRPYIPFASTTVSELRKQILATSQEVENIDSTDARKGIVLISIEGSWNNARKMVNKLPTHILRLDLGEEIATNSSIFEHDSELLPPTSSSPSLLAPLRRQGKGKEGWASNVSTIEATVIGLLALGLPMAEASRIITLARSKVDRIRHYTGRIYSRP